MIKLLSGNEAIALGAYHAGVRVATAYPGTPSTEILESIARFNDVYAEWSTNEKVALEVALGAAYTRARSMVSMKTERIYYVNGTSQARELDNVRTLNIFMLGCA